MVSLPVWMVSPDPSAPAESDPVMAAILGAPLAEAPETEDERAAFACVIAEVCAGENDVFAKPDDVAAAIAELRREQGE